MDTFAIFRTLYDAGILLTPAGGAEFDAEGPLTDDLRTLLRTHKLELLRELHSHRIGSRDEPWTDVPRRYVIPPSCLAPAVCHRLGQCRRPHTLHQCDERTSTQGVEQ